MPKERGIVYPLSVCLCVCLFVRIKTEKTSDKKLI